MPTGEQEALIALFRNRPRLAAELLGDALHVPLPEYDEARVESGDLTEVVPQEYRADVVVALRAGEPVLASVVEVQRGRDPDKRWSWPAYVTSLRARLRCPTVLMVVCIDSSIAKWCETPIHVGHPGWVLKPLVIGPGSVPAITDIKEAVDAPELAVLSAMVHGSERIDVLDAFYDGALANIDDERARLYADIVLGALRAGSGTPPFGGTHGQNI